MTCKTKINSSILSLLVFLLVSSFTVPEKLLLKKVAAYNSIYKQEKIYLHTNKPVYFSGEDIWFSAYLLDGNNKLNSSEKVLHIELIASDGQTKLKELFKINNGRAQGNLTLSDKIGEDKYLLIAYTNWMRNFPEEFFFKKQITIMPEPKTQNSASLSQVDQPTPQSQELTSYKSSKSNTQPATWSPQTVKQSPVVKFYPEGGNLINGIFTKVAFEIHASQAIAGVVKDEAGNFIAPLVPIWQNKGQFSFVPKAGVRYYAEFNTNGQIQKIRLPEVQSSGMTLAVTDNIATDQLIINISEIGFTTPKTFHLLIMQDMAPVTIASDTIFNEVVPMSIPNTALKPGIVQITLFNELKKPVAERLVLINRKEELAINISSNKTGFGQRDKVQLDIDVKDFNGLPVEGTFSLSVTDRSRLSDECYQPLNFVNTILFDSNIPGAMADYSELMENSKSAALKSDLLMLTNGWRHYQWHQVLKDTIDLPAIYQEPGLYVKGSLKKKNENKKNDKSIGVTLVPEKGFHIYSEETNDEGEFVFVLNDFTGTQKATFQTQNHRQKNVDLLLDIESNINCGVINKAELVKAFADTSGIEMAEGAATFVNIKKRGADKGVGTGHER